MSLAVRYLSNSAPRGRPKNTILYKGATPEIIEKKTCSLGAENIHMQMSVISALFCMKKITADHYEAANFYEELAYYAHKAMKAPVIVSNVLVADMTRGTHSNNVSFNQVSPKDLKMIKRWRRIRCVLQKNNPNYDDVLYQVIVEKKLGNELTKMFGVINKNLDHLKNGLQVVFDFMAKKRAYVDDDIDERDVN